MKPELILYLAGLGVYWLIYTLLLWIMIKIQKMNYSVIGLVASSALATGIAQIPFVGPYVGWAVLILCLWKVTGEDIWPDVFFTVAVAGALMFAVNLWVIGALMTGDMPDWMANWLEQDNERPTLGALVSEEGGTVLYLRGVVYSQTQTQQVALIGNNDRRVNVVRGETITIDTSEGPFRVRCDEIRSNSILLSVEGGRDSAREQVVLKLPDE